MWRRQHSLVCFYGLYTHCICYMKVYYTTTTVTVMLSQALSVLWACVSLLHCLTPTSPRLPLPVTPLPATLDTTVHVCRWLQMSAPTFASLLSGCGSWAVTMVLSLAMMGKGLCTTPPSKGSSLLLMMIDRSIRALLLLLLLLPPPCICTSHHHCCTTSLPTATHPHTRSLLLLLLCVCVLLVCYWC
jgi:hypothetical protein